MPQSPRPTACLALADGTVCRLFRDRDSGVWFIEAIVD